MTMSRECSHIREFVMAESNKSTLPKDTEEIIKRLAKDMSGGKLSAEEIEKKIREEFKKWKDGG